MTQIVEEEKGFGREHPGHGMVVGGYGKGQFWGEILTDERVPRSGATGRQSFPQAQTKSRIRILSHPFSPTVGL